MLLRRMYIDDARLGLGNSIAVELRQYRESGWEDGEAPRRLGTAPVLAS